MLERHSTQLAAFLLTVPLMAGALVGGPGLMPDSTPQLSWQPVVATKIDTSDRAAVRAALVKQLRPAVLEPIGWNGSTFPASPMPHRLPRRRQHWLRSTSFALWLSSIRLRSTRLCRPGPSRPP